MTDVFRAVQENGIAFRAQLIPAGPKWILWIAESSTEVYVVTIDQILRWDTYQPLQGGEEKVIVLYRSEDNYETIEIGNFSHSDSKEFINWLHSFISVRR